MIGHGATWPGGDQDVAVLREDEDSGPDETKGELGATEPMRAAFHLPDYVDDVPGFDGRRRARPVGRRARWQLASVSVGCARRRVPNSHTGAVPDSSWSRLSNVRIRPRRCPRPALCEQSDRFGRAHLQRRRAPDGRDRQMARRRARRTRGLARRSCGKRPLGDGADRRSRSPARSGANGSTQHRGRSHHALPRWSVRRPNGASIVRRVRPTQIWLRNDVLSTAGISEEDVAAALRTVTLAGLAGDVPYQDDPETPAFATAFPSSTIQRLGCLPK